MATNTAVHTDPPDPDERDGQPGLGEALDQWRTRAGELPAHGLGEGGDHGDTGEPIAPLYTSRDVEIDDLDDLGMPGEPPFVRGAYRTGYVKRPWFMTQYVGFGTVPETNARWRTLLAAGQRSVSLAFDLPSHLGYDSDHELAEHEVGKAGVAVDSLADFETLFDGIDLTRIPATFNTAAIAPIIVAMYRVTGERQGVAADQLMGTMTNDNLSAVFRGTSVFPPAAGVSLVVDVIEYCVEHMPRFTPINVQGVYMRSVGATKAQEVGYSFAFALAYLQEAVARGIPIEKVAPRFSFFFNSDSHIFEEAAKYRAGRKVWSELVRDRFGTQHRESRIMRATGASAARTYTKEEPEINLVRGAFAALGCALGGVQGMWLSSFDEAFATPTAKASRLSLRTMQILAEETGVRATVDPLGGGYFIEHLTTLMARQMHDHVNFVDEQGGAVAAAQSGALRRQMLENDLLWARERESGERHIVAHNLHRDTTGNGHENEVEFQRFDTAVHDEQLRRLREVKSRRNGTEVTAALGHVRASAAAGENIMPAVVEAVRVYATVGEITNELRAVHGEWVEPTV